jgi:hypothetical protein
VATWRFHDEIETRLSYIPPGRPDAGNSVGAPMRDTETFEYRGHLVTVDIRQFSAESDTGVYLTTIAIAAPGPDGKPGMSVYLCKRAQHVFLDDSAAYAAAVSRAQAHIDELAADGKAASS